MSTTAAVVSYLHTSGHFAVLRPQSQEGDKNKERRVELLGRRERRGERAQLLKLLQYHLSFLALSSVVFLLVLFTQVFFRSIAVLKTLLFKFQSFCFLRRKSNLSKTVALV